MIGKEMEWTGDFLVACCDCCSGVGGVVRKVIRCGHHDRVTSAARFPAMGSGRAPGAEA